MISTGGTEETDVATKLTKRTIDALPPGDPKGTWHADEELPGFFVVAYPSGAKVFMARFRVGSSRRVVKIGRYGTITADQAREKAKEHLSTATLGGDPAADRERARKMPTFKTWVETYLERVRETKKSPREDERFLPVAVKRWGPRPLDEITSEDVEALRQSLKRTPTSANRWLASVRACFSAAFRAGYIRTNPAKGLKLFRENPPRARVLNVEELRRFLEALDAEPDPHVHAAFRLLVETGARVSEVLHAKWEDFDLTGERGPGPTWRIPSPKSGKPQLIPLPSSAAELLRKLPHASGYAIAGRYPDRPRPDLKHPWIRLKTAAGLAGADVRTHDLRRSFGLAVAKRDGLHVASKLLRHSSVKVTESTYAPLEHELLRKAMERRASVLPFQAKAAPKKKKGAA
jgi:integrase